MVSFTGSTRAGKRVMELAAEDIKRVSLELGGKSANILLDDADFATAVPAGALRLLHELGPDLLGADPHAGPPGQAGRGGGAGGRCRRGLRARRPLRGRQAARPAGLGRAARPGAGLHQQGHRGGRQAGHRRRRGARGARQGLLRAADRLLRGDSRHDHRPGGDLRPGALHHPLRHRGRGDRDRQRHPLRAGRRRVERRHGAGRAGGPPAADRPGRHQRRRASTRRAPFGGYKQSGIGRERGKYGLEEFLETKAMQR